MNEDTRNTVILALRLARIYPGAAFGQIAHAVDHLQRAARRSERAAEDECNRQPRSADEFERRRALALKWAEEALAELGKPRNGAIRVEAGGDPRGYCLKLHHPDLPGNTWGGDESGYGV